MKIYLSSRFERQKELQGYADRVHKISPDFRVISRWLIDGHSVDLEKPKTAQCELFAAEDYEDVMNCDMFIFFSEQPGVSSRGGRHVEFGIALTLGIRILVVGPVENIFHYMPKIEHYDTFEDVEKELLLMD